MLGPLDTEAALQLLPQQIETMAALKRQLNYARPTFGYLDVELPADPVSGGTPGLPAEVRAALLPVAPSGPATAGTVRGGAADAAADAQPVAVAEREPDGRLGDRQSQKPRRQPRRRRLPEVVTASGPGPRAARRVALRGSRGSPVSGSS